MGRAGEGGCGLNLYDGRWEQVAESYEHDTELLMCCGSILSVLMKFDEALDQ